MKIRHSFVANSSSSSFIIDKKYISENQLDKIHNHIDVAKNMIKFEYVDERNRWYVDEDEYSVKLETYMDNFDMYEFLITIGVNQENIKVIY
jgi:hypothetical protein